MSLKKGNFIIRNAAGTVKLAGLATLTNDQTSAAFSDDTEVAEHRDALNVPRTFTSDFRQYTMRLTLIPGVGSGLADKATVLAAIAGLRKMDAFESASFEDGDLNWASTKYAFIQEVGKTLSQGNDMSVDVTVKRIVSIAESGGTVTETPINYGSWTQI